MHLTEILPRFNYQISKGEPYLWDSYGPNAWCYDFKHVSVIFDLLTQNVYELYCSPQQYADSGYHEVVYWVDPKYEVAQGTESKARGQYLGYQVHTQKTILLLCDKAFREATFDEEDIASMGDIEVDFTHMPREYEILCQAARISGLTPDKMFAKLLNEMIEGIGAMNAATNQVIG